MPAPQKILDLVQRFTDNLDDYKSGKYNETQVRREFIDPFFVALGWDVDNEAGLAEAYKDVIHEVSLKVGDSARAPDYGFRIGGTRKFFVEAKKPKVNIKDDIDPAYQLRRYAWSAKLPLSILTDFEEFAVYDTRVKPHEKDKASKARVFYFKFTDYIEKWDEIASIFSKDAILKGSFDRYVESNKKKRGTAEVDDAFLAEIEEWRELLAHNIALRNKELSDRELNTAVQITIDRLIFLRICEDRGIENYAQLQGHLSGSDTYDRLKTLFHRADEKYNSGLFHFRKEKGREDCDNWTLKLAIDDKPLKAIIKNLYYPDSPYEFSVLPPDILGQVYEQFLGKVIKRKGKSATVEDKPEVKKAGGVYYTPTYIVEYIVENTVGKLLEGKTPRQIEGKTKTGHPIRVLDPACGSGSFLIGAYQFLLDWYLEQYSKDHKKHTKGKSPVIVQRGEKDWILTLDERKRILLDHIYGVDIDPQAVEVTKLSLLLKVLETGELRTEGQYQTSFDRILPDLYNNIKCGNSLIGPDFYENAQLDLLDDETRYRVNAFDWESEFSDVFSGDNPGFDAIIGNPPYIFTRNQGIDEASKQYFYEQFEHQSVQLNTFAIFVEASRRIIAQSGQIGFITPNNWLTIDTFTPLRRFVLAELGQIAILNIKDKVFTAANVDTSIVLAHMKDSTMLVVGEIQDEKELFRIEVDSSRVIKPSYVLNISLLADPEAGKVIEKIDRHGISLRNFVTVSTGLKAYQVGKGKPPQTFEQKSKRCFHAERKMNDTYSKYLDGVDVSRYRLGWSGMYLSYGDWLAEPRKSVPFDGERILVRQIPSKPPRCINAVLTSKLFYNDINSMIIFEPKRQEAFQYLLGMLNARLLSFWFIKTFDKFQRKIFPQFKVKELAAFSMRPIDFSNTDDTAKHDQMVTLVDGMLDLNKRLADSKSGHEKTTLQRQIDSTDAQIDRLVYDLYGLTEDEIKIVEEATK